MWKKLCKEWKNSLFYIEKEYLTIKIKSISKYVMHLHFVEIISNSFKRNLVKTPQKRWINFLFVGIISKLIKRLGKIYHFVGNLHISKHKRIQIWESWINFHFVSFFFLYHRPIIYYERYHIHSSLYTLNSVYRTLGKFVYVQTYRLPECPSLDQSGLVAVS